MQKKFFNSLSLAKKQSIQHNRSQDPEEAILAFRDEDKHLETNKQDFPKSRCVLLFGENCLLKANEFFFVVLVFFFATYGRFANCTITVESQIFPRTKSFRYDFGRKSFSQRKNQKTTAISKFHRFTVHKRWFCKETTLIHKIFDSI